MNTRLIYLREDNRLDTRGKKAVMHLSSASPRGGGGPRADVAEYGDFMGTLQQISSVVVGEMWGLRFLNALLSGKMWAFVQLRGDWGRFLFALSMARWRRRTRRYVLKFIVFCLSNRPSVKNLYVFVGIGNFKIPLCINYCL